MGRLGQSSGASKTSEMREEGMQMKPGVTAFFDEATFTVSYVVQEPEGKHCAIIDSVLDFDPKSGRTSKDSADKVIAFVREHGLTVDWILETHAHADHLTAAPYLKSELGGQVGIGAVLQQHLDCVVPAIDGCHVQSCPA